MRVRIAVYLGLALAFGLSDQRARAASYQQIDGAIVDPIVRSNLGRRIRLSYPLPPPTAHSYVGPNLVPGAILTDAGIESADLSDADLTGAVLDGADLAGANLLGATLSGASLLGTRLEGAYYDETTILPIDFDPHSALMTRLMTINNGLAPPNPANMIDAPNYMAGGNWSYESQVTFIENTGCNSVVDYPCSSPGLPTTVSGAGVRIVTTGTSSFTGSIHEGGTVLALDSSTVVIEHANGPPAFSSIEASFSARDSSTMTIENCSNGCFLSTGGDATVYVNGGSFEDAFFGGRSHVEFAGGTFDYGDDVHVDDEALVKFRGSASQLWVNGGRLIMYLGNVDLNLAVGEDAVLENLGGQIEGYYGIEIDGTLLMSGGQLGATLDQYDIRVRGYAGLRGGEIQSTSSSGPLVSAGQGLIEIAGETSVNAYQTRLELNAKDSSRIRIFGSGFSVDAQTVDYGSLPQTNGTLTGLIEGGSPIDTTFVHDGGTCEGQPCTGRILVLAPGLDWDQDAVPNPFDNCAEEPNADQLDADTNGTGDVCFAPVDLDRDTVIDALDNCRVDANTDQADGDSDGIGDACDDSLVVWTDLGTNGCTSPPQPASYAAVTSDLGNSDVIDRAAQPCDCMGMEYPVEPGVASVRFLHVSPSGVVKEVCESAAPYAFGLAPGQAICSTSLAQDGAHSVMVTPYDAPGCETGDGEAMASSIRRFEVVPEPGMASMVGAGLIGMAALARKRARTAP